MRVAICIITRRRPDGLARLLRSLEVISAPDGVGVEVVVVENDAPTEKPPPGTSLRIHHAFEPEPGIPAARNRTLEIALADPGIDALAFLDDDETVESDWLAALLRTRSRTGGGRTVRAPVPPKQWASRARRAPAPPRRGGRRRARARRGPSAS